MKGYNKNRQKFNVQLSDGSNNISFEKMWALNQASKSPGFISNPLAKAYSNTFVSGGQILQGVGGIASAVPIPGVAIGGAALSMIGGLIDKPAAQKPTYGTETTTRYGMATGGSMESISPNAVEVTGAPNETDGNQINYKGQPINVDHGEVVDHSKDIVFSDKLFDPRSGKSFADTVKPMEKLIGKLSKMPSNINNNTIKALEQQKQKVFQTQEQVAAALGQRNQDGSTVQPGQPAMASGGYLGPGDPKPTTADSIMLMKNAYAKDKFYTPRKGYKQFKGTPENTKLIKNTKALEKLEKASISEKKRARGANDYYVIAGAHRFAFSTKDIENKTGKVPGSGVLYQTPDMLISDGDPIVDTYYNPKAPPIYFSSQIKPQGLRAYSNSKYSDASDVPYYDPIAIKPRAMRTDKDVAYIKKNYQEQYKQQYPKGYSPVSTPKPKPKPKPKPSPTPSPVVVQPQPLMQEPVTTPVNKTDVSQYMIRRNGKDVAITTEDYKKLMSSGKVSEYKSGKVLDKNKYNVKPLEQMNNFKTGGRIKSYASGGVPDLTQFFLDKPYQSAQQYASNTEPYIEETPKPRNTFKYAKGYQSYADLDLDRDDVQKQVEAFFASDAGQRYQRVQRGKNPKWSFYGPNQDANNTIGPKFAHLLADPEFQKLYRTPINTPPTTAKKEVYGNNPTLPIQEAGGYNAVLKPTNRYSKPGYADEAQNTYDTDRENARLAGTTEDNKRPGSEPFDAKGAIDQFYKDNPNSAQPLKKPSKFGLGDYLQLGAAGASVIGALLDKPEKQKPNLDRTQITQNKYDPANALMQNQYTTNAGMMANANNYSSAGVQAGLQNLMANKYRADSQVQSQYDQMNQQARTQYEQRLQQQNQFNAQTLSANDDKNVANRAAYTNNLYGALQTVSNVGKGFNQKATSEKAVNALIANDPQAAQGFLDPTTGQVDQTALEKNKQLRQMVYQTIDGKYFNADGTEYKKPTNRWSGGKIKLRRK